MADSTHHQAGQQHLALRQQAVSEAALEAHLQQQYQQALVAVQDLEHQRLQRLPQAAKQLFRNSHNPNFKE